MPVAKAIAHVRPVSGDVILYSLVQYMEWSILPDKRTLRLFTGLSNHPVVHLGEEESYDFYAAWMYRYGTEEQYRIALVMQRKYAEQKDRKQLGA